MASFVLQGNSTVAQTLVSGEYGFIGQNGSLAVDGTAIGSSGTSHVSLLGSLFGSDRAIDHDGGSFTLNIGRNGVAGSAGGDTIDVDDFTGTAFVANDGSLLSADDALDIRGTGSIRILNTGSISGTSDGIVTSASETGTARIVNHGVIAGGDGGIDHLGDGNATVINFGSIAGEQYGFDGSSGIDTLRNHGSIEGGVFTLEKADLVVNRGTIDAVDLGGGHDTYHGRGDGYAESVDGGGGKDRLIGSRADDTFTGGLAADTFVFGERGGSDIVTDFGGPDKIDLTALGLKNIASVLSAVEKIPGGVLIDLSGAHDLTIELEGVAKASLAANDFII